MKWFKHETDAVHSEKMNALIENFGFEGYGRYWRLLETVAERMDSSSRCHCELSISQWCQILKVKRKVLETFLKHLGNVFGIKIEQNENVLKITIPKLLNKRDNYTKNLQVADKKLPSKEKKRKEEKRSSPEGEEGYPPPSPIPENSDYQNFLNFARDTHLESQSSPLPETGADSNKIMPLLEKNPLPVLKIAYLGFMESPDPWVIARPKSLSIFAGQFANLSARSYEILRDGECLEIFGRELV